MTRVRVPPAPRWTCAHERIGYLRGMSKVLRWCPPVAVAIASLAIMSAARWVSVPCYAAALACYALELLIGLKLNAQLREDLGEMKGLTEKLEAAHSEHKRQVPVIVLEAVARDASAPDWVRSEAAEELLRRKQGLN